MGNQVGTKLENSALRSTAGSETHWLIFWHFDSHLIRLYHDIIGVILLLDGDANLFSKSSEKDVEEQAKYTATLDGKNVELTIVNDSQVTLGGVELFNANSKYSYNLVYDGKRIPHANERSATCPIQMLSTSFLLNTLRRALLKKVQAWCVYYRGQLYDIRVVLVKTCNYRFNDFAETYASDVYAYFGSQTGAQCNAVASVANKFIVTQGAEGIGEATQ